MRKERTKSTKKNGIKRNKQITCWYNNKLLTEKRIEILWRGVLERIKHSKKGRQLYLANLCKNLNSYQWILFFNFKELRERKIHNDSSLKHRLIQHKKMHKTKLIRCITWNKSSNERSHIKPLGITCIPWWQYNYQIEIVYRSAIKLNDYLFYVFFFNESNP